MTLITIDRCNLCVNTTAAELHAEQVSWTKGRRILDDMAVFVARYRIATPQDLQWGERIERGGEPGKLGIGTAEKPRSYAGKALSVAVEHIAKMAQRARQRAMKPFGTLFELSQTSMDAGSRVNETRPGAERLKTGRLAHKPCGHGRGCKLARRIDARGLALEHGAHGISEPNLALDHLTLNIIYGRGYGLRRRGRGRAPSVGHHIRN